VKFIPKEFTMRTLSPILIISLISVSGFGQTANPFAVTGSMSTARVGHTATLLKNGKVLIAGGNADLPTAELYDPATRTFAGTGNPVLTVATATLLADGRVLMVGASPLQDDSLAAELYDPSTGAFASPAGSLRGIVGPTTTTLLADGRVLMVGASPLQDNSLASAGLYDPSTGTLASAGSLRSIVSPATATLLNSGKVLITGANGPSPLNFVAEIYDPLAGTFTATGSMASAWGHRFPTATLLTSGKVLIAEGVCDYGYNPRYAGGSELYDPASGTFSATGNMPCGIDSTPTLLPNGKVLITGGLGAGTEVYDPSTGTFTDIGGINAYGNAATLLPDGTVLISGGSISSTGDLDCLDESVDAADLYYPSSGTLGSAGVMTTPRSGHRSTLLSDGTVLISGGEWLTPDEDTVLASAEIYTPPTPRSFFSGEDAVTNSFYYLQFPDANLFGYYVYVSSSILYHVDLGYEGFIPSTANSIYFYDFASTHWWYSTATLFPYLYDFTLQTWIYYFPDTKNPGHYTTNPRIFSNLTTLTIFTM
jgi:hypothetical protein